MVKAIALLSGGLDSLVALHLAVQESQVRAALTFNYGQRAVEREISASEAICRHYAVPHIEINLPWLAGITETALVNKDKELPHLDETDLQQAGPEAFSSAKAVWVPNRNGVFINIAAAYADAWNCGRITVGFNAEEGATFPDNTPEYALAVTESLKFSTQAHPEVWAPTRHLDKPGIVSLARRMGVPLELAWPCYRGGELLCWECESCLRFRRALEITGNWDWYLSLL